MSAQRDTGAVRAMLQRFQDGYSARNAGALDSFMELFVPDEDLEVIGTNAVTPGEGEWCLGPAAARKLVEGDWEGWGDVRLDVPGARIHVLGDVAWLATTATVAKTIPAGETYANHFAYLKDVIDGEGQPEAKLAEILRAGSNALFELERGEQFTWPFRFTAVLVRREDRWRFCQMHFSFPTTRFPDVRIV